MISPFTVDPEPASVSPFPVTPAPSSVISGVPAYPGCVVASMITEPRIVGSSESSVRVVAPDPIENSIVLVPGNRFAAAIIARKEVSVLSAVVVTVNSASSPCQSSTESVVARVAVSIPPRSYSSVQSPPSASAPVLSVLAATSASVAWETDSSQSRPSCVCAVSHE